MFTTGLWAIPRPFLVSQLLGEGAGQKSRVSSPVLCVCVPGVKAAAPLCQHDIV